jgi:hypothetical protein
LNKAMQPYFQILHPFTIRDILWSVTFHRTHSFFYAINHNFLFSISIIRVLSARSAPRHTERIPYAYVFFVKSALNRENPFRTLYQDNQYAKVFFDSCQNQ